MSRSGIGYTHHISIKNSALRAPKLFRRSNDIKLNNVHFSDAEETMWSCKNINITSSQISGNYFGKDSENIYFDHVSIIGNYAFDGAKNVEVHNSTFISKDAFWNCENVKVYDSVIDGEYLAWNTKNIHWIDTNEISQNSEELASFIRKETGLLVSAGSVYRGNGNNFLRMNLACPEKLVKDD